MTSRRHPRRSLDRCHGYGGYDDGVHAERGAAALLALLLIGGALSSAVALVATSVTDSAVELHVRLDVMCARYAAAGALAAGQDANGRPELISPAVSQLKVVTVRRNPQWCVLRASARCNDAVRSREHTIACTP